LYTARVDVRRAFTLALVSTALIAGPGAAAENPVAALSLIRPKPVQSAQAFEVVTADNRPLALSAFKGKVVFLNFWATWCKPCEEEMPAMERLYRRFKDRGLVVLALAEDREGAGAVAPYLKKRGLTFPVGLDPKMEVASLYGVWAIPSTYIIDKKGDRALFANGPREWDGPHAVALFESLLK